MRSTKLTADQVLQVDAIIAGVIRNRYGNPPYPAAMGIQDAIVEAGFEIVPKAKAGRPYIMERTTVDGVTTVRTAELVPGQETANEKAVREQDEISARISEARRLGDWSRVTDADMLAMMSPIPGGRTYGNDDDIVGRTFHDAAGGTFRGAMRVVREVTRLRDKIRMAWAGGRGTWDADAFARLQELAPEIASELDRFLTKESRETTVAVTFLNGLGREITMNMQIAGLR
ncbi:hypothetical protein ASF60_18085 [Methylobacterium sp. Leaf113]|uniref:hypothetical protein n=1 Tax=Methylobacterium sp. Leaf113 TaxID=1736259 RepID=UPI0006F3757A|nr:hypothetical protein [Methylobacterium sp. Leaf113]KQP91354.1 hypothetical protein ASF60_18085 [Methylobacterium sp. Leaf113]